MAVAAVRSGIKPGKGELRESQQDGLQRSARPGRPLPPLQTGLRSDGQQGGSPRPPSAARRYSALQTEADPARAERALSVFNVVTFPNTVCSSTSGYNGTCYTGM